jgi:hypothetical protein
MKPIGLITPLLFAILLSVCLATWIYTYRITERRAFVLPTAARDHDLYLYRGEIGVSNSPGVSDDLGKWVVWAKARSRQMDAVMEALNSNRDEPPQPRTDPPLVREIRSHALPLWIPTLICAALTAATLRRARRAAAFAPGACPVCGYDLRASPGRCPECGSSPTPDAVKMPK